MYPVLPGFLHGFLNPLLALFYSFAHSASYRFFKSLLSLQKPWAFSATYFPKYLIGCISHFCIARGYLGISVHIIAPQTMVLLRQCCYKRLQTLVTDVVHRPVSC